MFLTKRLEMLEKNVQLIKKQIGKYPQGYLKINKQKGGFYYRIADSETGKRSYVGKERINDVCLIAQRDYEIEYLKIAENEISELKRYLSHNYIAKTQECYANLHAGRKCLVKPFEVSDIEFINRWMEKPYVAKEFSENDDTEYYTEKGERVRSKSELIIANTLLNLNIPYKYECPLVLDGITLYPDFTVLDVKERKEKYIEHFGMMGDADYVANMLLKVSTYERNGIYSGDELICTFESVKKPLNVNVLRNKIEALLC